MLVDIREVASRTASISGAPASREIVVVVTNGRMIRIDKRAIPQQETKDAIACGDFICCLDLVRAGTRRFAGRSLESCRSLRIRRRLERRCEKAGGADGRVRP